MPETKRELYFVYVVCKATPAVFEGFAIYEAERVIVDTHTPAVLLWQGEALLCVNLSGKTSQEAN